MADNGVFTISKLKELRTAIGNLGVLFDSSGRTVFTYTSIGMCKEIDSIIELVRADMQELEKYKAKKVLTEPY